MKIPYLLSLCFFCFSFLSAQISITCADTAICNQTDTSCASFITLMPDVAEACSEYSLSYTLDLNSDGTVDEQGDLIDVYSAMVPYGTHVFSWIVSDSCDTDSCAFSLDISDCTAPNIDCLTDLITIVDENEDCCELITVDEVINDSLENCGTATASFDPDSLVRELYISSGLSMVSIYYTDENGNQSICIIDFFLQTTGECPSDMEFECSDTTICESGDTACFSFVTLSSPFPVNGLSYDIDLHSDGTVDLMRDGGVLSENLTYGQHTVHWYMNFSECFSDTCTQGVTVADCSAPPLDCFAGVISLPLSEDEDCAILELSGAQDTCGGVYSYSRDSILLEYEICCDEPNQGVMLYAFDDAGNIDSCAQVFNLQIPEDHPCLVSTNNERSDVSIEVIPNPYSYADNHALMIQFSKENYRVKDVNLYNASGEEAIVFWQESPQGVELKIEQLVAGVYFLQATMMDGDKVLQVTEKIVIK